MNIFCKDEISPIENVVTSNMANWNMNNAKNPFSLAAKFGECVKSE